MLNYFKLVKENKKLRELQKLAEDLKKVETHIGELEYDHYKTFREVMDLSDEDKYENIFREPFARVISKMKNNDVKYVEFFEHQKVQELYEIKVKQIMAQRAKRSIEVDIGTLKNQLFGRFHF